MFTLADISYTEIPSFLLISIVGMLLLSIIFGLLTRHFILAPVLTFVFLGIAAFILPNFFDIKYQPLLGYATFLTVISLILSILFWYLMRDRRKQKKIRREAQLHREDFENKYNRKEKDHTL
ncbi:hypothetical protein GCM10007190_12810 [Macrococcus hajekii]|uniref:hypothetical protein n=1 Tax=Macrococcus hajekii TaxID=198482 RepID=UPI00166562E3|nr:hypothetical protein [Macrococcus hajekii]GGB06207.1 hypothetical protein GCM10007190_12810 [Macrococcus hajekii]